MEVFIHEKGDFEGKLSGLGMKVEILWESKGCGGGNSRSISWKGLLKHR
jgi:hypothetical protein